MTTTLPAAPSLATLPHTTITTTPTTESDPSEEQVVLGQGSYGLVEKVSWGDRWYARKTMLLDSPEDGLSCCTLRECDVYARFASPFMSSVFRMEIKNNSVCLWMGLADVSLAKYIESKPTFRERVQMAGQVLWAGLNFLQYIHTYNVFHRDLKPDNILLRKSGNLYSVYVSDMGSARWSYRGMKLTGGMGTRCYRPPEMNTTQYGKPAEVYGLGVTVIHLLHGAHPLRDQGTNPETLPSHWHHALLAYQSYLPATLFDLLERTIRHKAPDRITVRGALEHEFFQGTPIPPIPKMQGVPPPGREYLARVQLTGEERRVWIEYLIDVGASYGCSAWIMTHAVHALDDYLASIDASIKQQHQTTLHCNPLELYVCVCLWMISKYFDVQPIAVGDLVHQCQQRFTAEHFVEMEQYMIQMLRFRLLRRPPLKGIQHRMEPHYLKIILGAEDYTEGVVVSTRVLRIRCVTARNVY